MKILYVTDLFSGIKPVLFEGNENPKGSPAFFEPLRKIIEDGNIVDIIAPKFDRNLQLKVGSSLFINSNIILFYYNNSILTRIFSDVKFLIYIYCLIKRKKYDFVYGHGSFGIYGTLVANILNIPCGARLYGSFLFYHLKKFSKLKLLIRYYRQYLPFITKKDFLIITNDGTKGDKLYQLIGRKNIYNFYFLLNGVNKKFYQQDESIPIKRTNILFYAARIEEWKNQEFAIEIMKELHIKGNHKFELYFAGSIYDQKYWSLLQEKINLYNLQEYVKYVGSLSKEELKENYFNSFAVLSFYNYSNLGNVSIEALISGSLLISLNDGSLDKIVENGKSAILVESPKEAVSRIMELLNEDNMYNKIRMNAAKKANDLFQTWDERAKFELDLINNIVGTKC